MSRDSTFSLPSDKRRKLLDQATREYAESVSLAKDYLLGRGFDEETIDYWQLGYVFEPLPGHERFKGYLSIPYLTKAGCVAIKFRCIKCDGPCENHPKYDSEAGAGTYLFGSLSFWVDSPVICVTEGELDAIACGMAGLPAVGISGASKWLKHWQYCFEGYEEVIVLADGDKPGEKLASNVSNHVYSSRVITFPSGQDVNSYLVEHGPEALRAKVLGNER
jgi:DNA primase